MFEERLNKLIENERSGQSMRLPPFIYDGRNAHEKRKGNLVDRINASSKILCSIYIINVNTSICFFDFEIIMNIAK